MARVAIDHLVTVDRHGLLYVVAGASVQVNFRGGGPAPVYAAATGVDTLSNPLTTAEGGRIDGYVAEGSYDLVVSDLVVAGEDVDGYTRPFEAWSGQHETSGGGGGIIDAVFHEPGDAELGESDPHPSPAAGSLTTVRLRARSAPVGSALAVAFKLNGDTIATLTIPAGSTAAQSETLDELVAEGDLLTVEPTSIGSTTPAGGVVAQFVGLVEGTTSADAPLPPSGLVATAASYDTIGLTWFDNSDDETSFRLERSTTIDFTSVTSITLPANTESYSDTGLDPDTTYYYRIRAVRTGVSSDWSSVAGATTLFGPGQIGGLLAWFKADAITGRSDGDAVGTWPDSSSGAHDATQATGSKQPTYRSGVLNGKPVLRFDGTDDFLTAAGVVAAQPSTIFVVAKLNASIDGVNVIDGANARQVIFNNVGDAIAWHAGASRSSGSTWGTTAFRLISAIFNNAADQLWVDGVQQTILAPGSNTLDGLRIATKNDATSAYWPGDIAEIIIYSGALSTVDRQAIESYLATKYGL